MYKPEFPYLGNQALISSGRVLLHSSDDFIFNFGKKGVSLSSPVSITMDAGEKVIIASPRIDLGNKADEQVLLGNTTVKQLGDLCDAIKALSEALKQLSDTNFVKAIPGIVTTSTILADRAKEVKTQLEVNCLSKTTYTK